FVPRSPCSLASSFLNPRASPPGPHARYLAGTPRPAPVSWLARAARSLPHFSIRGLRSAAPLHDTSRGPRAPRRCRGSLALLARFLISQSGAFAPRPPPPPPRVGPPPP